MPRRKPAPPVKSPSQFVPMPAVMSFLKQTRGLLTWTLSDLQKSLLITAAQAQDVLTALEFQGYIKQAEDSPQEWLTTLNGEAVSGSKPPRFARESVEKASDALRERLHWTNKDSRSTYNRASRGLRRFPGRPSVGPSS